MFNKLCCFCVKYDFKISRQNRNGPSVLCGWHSLGRSASCVGIEPGTRPGSAFAGAVPAIRDTQRCVFAQSIDGWRIRSGHWTITLWELFVWGLCAVGFVKGAGCELICLQFIKIEILKILSFLGKGSSWGSLLWLHCWLLDSRLAHDASFWWCHCESNGAWTV